MAYLGAPILWITILAPVVLAVVGLLLRDNSGKTYRFLAYTGAFLLFIPAVLVLYYSYTGALAAGIIDPVIADLSSYRIGRMMLVLDGLSSPVVLGISVVTALVSVYSIRYMTHRIREMEEHGEKVPGFEVYYALYAGFAASMLGMAYASNLILFFIFLELSLLTSFALIAYYGYGDRGRISLLYFVWTHIAGALFLAGVLYYGLNRGTFDVVVEMDGAVGYIAPSPSYQYLDLAVAAIILGLLVKMAVFGVHMWLPYAHAEAPTPVSALLSPNLIGIAGYALARFVYPLFPGIIEGYKTLLLSISILTIVYGGLVALRQVDFKRFLAYSSVSQMGYMLLGLATLTSMGIGGAMLHYLSHAIGKAVLFMVAGVFITELGTRDITRMGGLARRYPILAAVTLLGFMHLVGIPPALGMWSEVLIVYGIFDGVQVTGQAVLWGITLVLILAFMVTAAYSFVAMRRIFFGPPRIEASEYMDDFKATIVLVGVLGVFFFISIGTLSEPLRVASELLVRLMGG